MAEHHRLFFALWPDPAIRARIAAAADDVIGVRQPQGRRNAPARYHMTLQFLGDHMQRPVERIAAAAAAGDRVHASAFDLVLDRAGCFPQRRIPWWLGCTLPHAGLDALREALAAALRDTGVPLEQGRGFVPHVTVLRNATEPLQTRPIAPIAWPVHGFVLIDSRAGEGGDYELLRQWELT